jgi:hypothetical protein
MADNQAGDAFTPLLHQKNELRLALPTHMMCQVMRCPKIQEKPRILLLCSNVEAFGAEIRRRKDVDVGTIHHNLTFTQ